MLGAGWSVTSSPTAPSAVAVFVKVPWDRANEKMTVSLFLHDADGTRVERNGNPIGIERPFEVGRPPGLAAGSNIDAAFQLTVPSLPLDVGRYQWRLSIGEQDFAVSFEVRAG